MTDNNNNKKTKKDRLNSLLEKIRCHPIRNIIGIASAITILFSAVFLFDDRYAHADEFKKFRNEISEMNHSYAMKTDSIRKSMLIQARMRRTILEMKELREGLSAEEKVELRGLKEQIATLEDQNRG